MEHRTETGMNRTGIQMSPVDTKRMLEGNPAGIPEGDESVVTEMRSDYINEAEPVGTVPMPGTVKGAAKTGAKKLTGKNPEVFIDKLGERLAFERGGTRLYEALLTKCEATIADGAEELPGEMSIVTLRRFHDEEAEHFEMLAGCMEELGADPTAQTPAADVTGVESFGIMQVLNDPRTTVAQSLNALLVAELADYAGWDLLIKLAVEMKQPAMAKRFRAALEQENEHMMTIKQWLEDSVLSESA